MYLVLAHFSCAGLDVLLLFGIPVQHNLMSSYFVLAYTYTQIDTQMQLTLFWLISAMLVLMYFFFLASQCSTLCLRARSTASSGFTSSMASASLIDTIDTYTCAD